MRIRHTICTIILVVLWMAVPVTAEDEVSDFTLMIYLNGSDLESEYHSATSDLLEMLEGYVSSELAVIIETGGTETWHTDKAELPEISSSHNQRWRLTDRSLELLETLPAANMGDGDTLTDFLDYGKANYPSDQYGLILWNHGAGSVYGFGADELYDYDTLDLSELQEAMENHWANDGTAFDFIGFDACLMASLETAVVLEPYAKLLIGSEELEPVHGWNYETIMNTVSSSENPQNSEIGKAIMEGFISQAQSLDTADALTISMIDLEKIPAVIRAADALFARVAEGLSDAYYQDILLKARLEAESYGEGSEASDIPDSDMVDLVDYAVKVNDIYPYQSEQLVLAVEEAVISHANSLYKPNANGLSAYIPARDGETMEAAAEIMSAIGMPEGQLSLIETVDEIINGMDHSLGIDGQVDNLDTTEALEFHTGIEGNDSYFHFELGQENLDKVSAVNTIMGRIDSTGDIQYLRLEQVEDTAILDTGTIVGETVNQLLKVNGTEVAMYYEGEGPEGNSSYFIPITLNGEDADLMVLVGNDYPYGKILGARKLNDENQNIYNRSLIELQAEDLVETVFEYDSYDILSDSYSYDDWYIVDMIRPDTSLTLSWHPLPQGEYAYAFEISDIYGNYYQTDWIVYDQSFSNSDAGGGQLGHLDGTEYSEDFMYPWDSRQEDRPSDWALPYVSTAYNNGLVTERTSVGFTEDISREMFCELVVNMYEIITGEEVKVSIPVDFADTDNPAVEKAYSLGVVSGYGDGNFGPDDLITREQLIVMFFRTLVRLDGIYGLEDYQALNFADSEDLSVWAVSASEAMVGLGLINGVGDNQLAPGNNATVEQSLKLVNGVYEFYVSTHR